MENEDLPSLLQQSQRLLQAEIAIPGADSMLRPLADLVSNQPVTCLPGAPVRAALEAMHNKGVGSVVVTNAQDLPVGIFTRHDVLDRLALAGVPLDAPVDQVMSVNLATLPPQATAYDAALLMVRRGIRHVPVVEGGRLVGVVSERDLFNLQRVSYQGLAKALRKAENLKVLIRLSREIRQTALNMLAQGMGAEQLTQLIASYNDLLTGRVIELEFAAVDLEGLRFCWIALGSEGRSEQTFSTDQDNGIIFAQPENLSLATAREKLLPVAKRINQALDQCGFPLCKGGIMAGNLMWCLSLKEWQEKFSSWINNSNPEALLHASIFFDFRAIYGETGLAAELRRWLNQHVSKNERFFHQMAANALRNKPPLGFIKDFSVASGPEQADTIDLKMHGTTLFSDAARIYSLACGVDETNTLRRLRLAAPCRNLPAEEVESWAGAFLFLQLLRLRHQQPDSAAGRQSDNRINPYRLNELDRRILKQALLQARKLQARLALDYQV